MIKCPTCHTELRRLDLALSKANRTIEERTASLSRSRSRVKELKRMIDMMQMVDIVCGS